MSPAFQDGAYLPRECTCDGEGISPPLSWIDVPEGTESLALMIDDPDAPAGTFVHWLVWNVPPGTTEIEQGKRPAGAVEGTTSAGKPGYFPPAPPSGTHRYQFKLYALDTVLNLPHTAGEEEFKEALQGNVIAEAQLTGLYQRLKQ